ncbi:asparaginase [Mumia sp. zg.B53]|uniref:asparaginase domain-containing protein n=1 Tax=unclassified Mumia TaxID=2621872 RepID=UPI001C6E6E2E|nr:MULTISPECIES: asparaginase domain-containing protein [unclassified Mumia]MBW9209004.1 asparaginase [Mumia sp. zg.B21]MBW9213615.1 asparaginase [Mumia sp. zg.B53]MDD9347481.1 asparaginase domain-containing protein [Mumia sp.]
MTDGLTTRGRADVRTSPGLGGRRGVLVIVTGGTATMSPGSGGGLEVSAEGVDVLRAVVDGWAAVRHVPAELVLDLPLRDSAEMGPQDWNRWQRQIRAALPSVAGVVLVHGTDSMAFSAGALAYALADAPRPVVLTGAQRGPNEPGSDVADNLRLALDAAIEDRPGVSVAFAGRVLAAATAWKRSTTDLDGFAGDPGTSRRRSALLPVDRFQAYAAERFVALATVTLDHWHDQLAWSREPAGVVVRVFGGGTAPRDPVAESRLLDLRDAGIPVVAVSQTPAAVVDLTRYAAGRVLVEGGVVSCGAMTVEAAYTKLHYLLGCGLTYDELTAALAEDLVGEARLA